MESIAMESVAVTSLEMLDPHLRQAASLFDSWAEAGRADRMAEGHWPRVAQILDKMALTPGQQVLDVGCGNGYAVRAMAEAVAPEGVATGVDLSEGMLQQARVQTLRKNVRFEQAPAHALPFEVNSFDTVLSVEVLYYTPDPAATVAEWARVLRPGGTLWVMVDYYREHPNSECWAENVGMALPWLSEAEYRDLFTQAGLVDVRSERLMDPTPVDAEAFTPGWGYDTPEDMVRFRTEIGSLLICGRKPE